MTAYDARRSLRLFFALVIPASAALQLAIAKSERKMGNIALVLALMWTPGIASMIVRAVRREGFGDVSFRLGGARGAKACGIVIAYPLLVGAVAYGLAWSAGLATFAPPPSTFGIHPPGALAQFALRLAVILIPGIPFSMISALGEEIGWRGFFVTRLIAAGVPKPLLVSGIVWGLWHVPLILAGVYAVGPSPLLSSVVFVVSIIPASYLYGWSRLVSGSVWPAAVGHAAWNSIIQGAFDASTAGSSALASTNVWIGESGIFVAVASIVFLILLVRRPFPVLERPTASPERELSLRTA